MASILLPLSKVATLAAPALLWAGGIVAQAPDQTPDQLKLRQPTTQSVQHEGGPQADADKSRATAERRVREMDRRLNRTLRSVCAGC